MKNERLHQNSSHLGVPQKPLSVNHVALNGMHHPMRPFPYSENQRVTVSLPIALIERLRNAVYWTGHRSLVALVAEGIEDIVPQMEVVNGEAFPQRVSPLKRGRRQGKRHPAALTTPPHRHEQDLRGNVKERAQILSKIMPDDLLQLLFAIGLNLEAIKSTTPLQHHATTDTPLNQAIVQLNHVIHEIRDLMEKPGSGS